VNLYLQKTDLEGLLIIEPRYPRGIEKHIWMKKTEKEVLNLLEKIEISSAHFT